jgi:hypothetical protein
MKHTRPAKAGLVLTGLGLLIFLGVAIWLKTIRTTLVDIPMPMRAEATSKDFTVDYDGPIYTMTVQFDRSVPPTTARCLLGGGKSELRPDLDCTNTAPLLKFSWELIHDGQIGGTGSSADMGSISTTDTALNVMIVGFPAQKKHRYRVTLKFDQDASDLKVPPPRVRVELDGFTREDIIFAGAAFDSVGLALCLIGMTMFLVSFLRARFSRHKTPNPTNLTPG